MKKKEQLKKKNQKRAGKNEKEESLCNEHIFDIIKDRDRFGVPVELNLKG